MAVPETSFGNSQRRKKGSYIIVKQPEEKYPTAPDGTWAAVCVDEIDLGMVTTTFNGEENTRHMVRLVWQIEELDDKGKRFLIKKDYTASLHEKAKLRSELKSWRGREFTFEELVAFDLEQIISAPCLLSIVHNIGRKGGTFANVGAVMKLPKNIPPMKPEGYVRVKDRSTADAPALVSQPRNRQAPPEEAPPQFDHITDDDVPF